MTGKTDVRELNRAKLYVKIYNKIKEMIDSGVFATQMRLPGENELAATFGVSRVTLRQALALLQEDGFIESRHGLGNFVCKRKGNAEAFLAQFSSPMGVFVKDGFNSVSIDREDFIGDTFTNEMFNRDVPAYSGVIRKYYKNTDCVALSYSCIALDYSDTKATRHYSDEELIHYLAEDIYSSAYGAKIDIQVVPQTNLLKNAKFSSPDKNFFLILEIIFDAKGLVVIYNKHYIPLSEANIRLMFLKNGINSL
ncbi:GntR family transcriptional regulator [Salmonella enterica subsp. enterica]|nr:GntR family transcriptional regulator [Salmonella enterica subsp. enterica serovar Sandiego]EHF4788554.1 GntR family transcriptional regulator [Salmonella enterica]HCL4786629.1 GntR family transcriptional regulator [Salmonella enterica]